MASPVITTQEPKGPVAPPVGPKENKNDQNIHDVNINLLTSMPKGADTTTARSVTTRTSTREPTTAASTTKSSTTLRKVKVTTSEPVTEQQTTAKPPSKHVPNPTYKILEPDFSTQNPGALSPGGPGAGSNKGVVIGAVVGVLLGIVLIVAIILLVFFMKKRRRRHQKQDIMQVENPRYQPISDRKRGEFRFSESERKGGAIYTPTKIKNNNRDSDIEVLATRSSTRKKRQAPPPPNPFGEDQEFTGDRRASRDPELSPGPVELSTFSPKSDAIQEDDTEPSADKPLLSKGSSPANGSVTRQPDKGSREKNPFGDEEEDEDSGVDKDGNDDDNIDKLVAEHKAKSGKLSSTPDDYDKTKNPFA